MLSPAQQRALRAIDPRNGTDMKTLERAINQNHARLYVNSGTVRGQQSAEKTVKSLIKKGHIKPVVLTGRSNLSREMIFLTPQGLELVTQWAADTAKRRARHNERERLGLPGRVPL